MTASFIVNTFLLGVLFVQFINAIFVYKTTY